VNGRSDGRKTDSATSTAAALAEMLRASLPARLRDEIGVDDAKEWVREHLEVYSEEAARFPNSSLLPWTNMAAYDDWEQDAFFVIVTLRPDAIELFCGTGPWVDLRRFGEGEADEIPASELHRAWLSRFAVPHPPVVISRAAVKKWLGREW
jgi:hypothetical protein